MNRRQFLATSSLAMAAQAAPRPNILFLIADDLTWNGIRAMGNREVQTPHLDRLMARGCTFTHCFHQGSWTGAVCVASRSMLNSGLTAFRAQKQFENVPLWGQTFGEAGYQTRIVGKWHLSDAAMVRSFQKREHAFNGGMFESGPAAYNRPAEGNTWTAWDTSLGGQWQNTQKWQDGPAAVKHSARIWAENAAAAIQAHTGQADPFLLYVAFTSPHDPRQAPKEFTDQYPPAKIVVPPNYLPRHPFDQGDGEVRDEKLAPFPRTREAVQVHRAEYYAHITYLDHELGNIFEALEKSGQAENTLIIFTADHGLAVGQHGLIGKQNLYEHSTRIPLIFAGPGIPKGKRVDELVYQHSVFATACELAAVGRPAHVEFPSLAGLIRGQGKPVHDSVFCWYRHFQRSVRTKEHRLIVYPEAKRVQLFDLGKDPWETKDLSESAAHKGLRGELVAKLRAHQEALGDPLV